MGFLITPLHKNSQNDVKLLKNYDFDIYWVKELISIQIRMYLVWRVEKIEKQLSVQAYNKCVQGEKKVQNS